MVQRKQLVSVGFLLFELFVHAPLCLICFLMSLLSGRIVTYITTLYYVLDWECDIKGNTVTLVLCFYVRSGDVLFVVVGLGFEMKSGWKTKIWKCRRSCQ